MDEEAEPGVAEDLRFCRVVGQAHGVFGEERDRAAFPAAVGDPVVADDAGAWPEQAIEPATTRAVKAARTDPRTRGDSEGVMGASFVPPF